MLKKKLGMILSDRCINRKVSISTDRKTTSFYNEFFFRMNSIFRIEKRFIRRRFNRLNGSINIRVRIRYDRKNLFSIIVIYHIFNTIHINKSHKKKIMY